MKKGQAAMEFLMTYGWAILAAIIVVGVLWYLIGNPAGLAGNKFTVSAPLVQNAMAISTTGVEIEFRNGGDQTITITEVGIETCGTYTPTVGTDDTIAAGALQSYIVGCALNSGDRFNGDVTISYTTAGSSVVQKATGSISGRVP